MNRLTLKYDFDIDFDLIAITCPLKDYRLCYFINKEAGTDFRKIDDHHLWLDDRQSYFFGRYLFEDEPNETSYFILNNKGIDGGFLIPEMKATDFFVLIKNPIDEELIAWQLNQINRIRDVVVASEIDPHKLKSRENLLF